MAARTSRSLAGYTRYNAVKLIHGGEEYFEWLLRLINEAKYSIHLQVYIYDEDETGQMVADALIAAAGRGIQVFLLADGYASQNISRPFINRIRNAGIHFRFFEPVLKSKQFYFGRRLHHKVLVTDAHYSLVGGINISDKYNSGADDRTAWLDWALYAEGEVARPLFQVCLDLWARTPKELRRLRKKTIPEITNPTKVCQTRVRRNDWVQRRNQITKSYLHMLRDAQSEVIIMSSYFLPGRVLRRNLYRAARRGVKIRLILAGTSDITLAKHAERYIYRKMLKRGIEVYEYRKTVLHGKIATYDDKWSTIGSYNVNNISAFASIELNIDVLQDHFAQSLRKELEEIMQSDCTLITDEVYRTHYNFFSRIRQRVSYEIFRLLFFLFTFYFKQRS